MKFRIGFVSNSSSESFLIYGARFDTDRVNRFQDEIFRAGLLIECNPYNDTRSYVGKSWDAIKDNETGADFKKDIREKLKAIFLEDIECETYSEVWYDG